jgi:hypothetical protein
MNMISRAATGLAGGVLILAGLGTTAANAATPVETGCPAGYDTVRVDVWVALGYAGIVQLDDPANGGNGDGILCHRQLNDVQREKFCATRTCPEIVYWWVENFRAAHK